MKKKLMFLFVGVLGLAAFSHAQPPPVGVAGVFVNGVQVVAGQAIPLNSMITFNGQMFAIAPTPAPNNQIPVAEQIAFAFGFNNVVVDLNGNGANNTTGGVNANGDAFFGTSINDFTVVAVPFDFGLSAVLGAGALGAVRAARKRKKQEEVSVA